MLQDYLSQKDKMPPLCPKEKENAMKELILEKLSSEELMYLSTVSPNGWPIVDCMHFTTVKGENNRPIIYMFTHDRVRKLENIENDNRVAVSACHAVSFERRNEVWSFQFMCTAKVITDKKEIEEAIRATREKKGYEFASHLPLEEQPCLKIEPVFGAWMCGEGEPNACSIDYCKEGAI